MEDILIDAAPDDFRRDRVPWVFMVILCIPREVFAACRLLALFLPRVSHTHVSPLSDSVSVSNSISDLTQISDEPLPLSLSSGLWPVAWPGSTTP